MARSTNYTELYGVVVETFCTLVLGFGNIVKVIPYFYFCRLWNKELLQSERKKKEPSLLKVILKAFGARAFFYGFLIALSEMLFK